MDHGLRARLTAPVGGWMTFELRTLDDGRSILVSYTPSDFLGELLTALILAASGVEGVAIAHSEPNAFAIRFTPDRERGQIALKVIEFPGGRTQGPDGEPRMGCIGDSETIVVPLWRAVGRLGLEVRAEDYRREMRWEFPAHKLARLTDLLGKP